MKNKELINILKGFPLELDVCIDTNQGFARILEDVEIKSLNVLNPKYTELGRKVSKLSTKIKNNDMSEVDLVEYDLLYKQYEEMTQHIKEYTIVIK